MSIRILEDAPLSDPTDRYNHLELAIEAMKHPGRWVTDDDENVPQVTSTHIREGRLVDYRPAGSFAVRRRTVEGKQRFDVRFIGVPLEPWTPPSLGGDGRTFTELQRTLDPREMPHGTPDHVVLIAQDLLDATIAAGEAKAGKKRDPEAPSARDDETPKPGKKKHKADESKPAKKKGKKKKAKKHRS